MKTMDGQYIEPTDGVYTVSFTNPGSYAFDVCVRDAAGNHSPARRVAFTISDELLHVFNKGFHCCRRRRGSSPD